MTDRPIGIATLAALLTGAFLLCAGPARAGEETPQAPECEAAARAEEAVAARERLSPELRAILDHLDQANKPVKDVTASVIYERSIPLLEEKESSKGTLVVKKPNRIALRLRKPRNEEVYTDGKTWWVVSNNDKEVQIFDAAKEGQSGVESVFLDFGYGRGSQKILEEYDVELAGRRTRKQDEEQETLYRLKFTPRRKPGRPARYVAIEIEVSDRLWLPEMLALHEGEGIVHTYSLSKIRLNAGVKDSLFEYRPRRGYHVWRPEDV